MHLIISQFWQLVLGMLTGLFIGFLLVATHAKSRMPEPKASEGKSIAASKITNAVKVFNQPQ